MFNPILGSGGAIAGLFLMAAVPFGGAPILEALGDKPPGDELATKLAADRDQDTTEASGTADLPYLNRTDDLTPEFAVGETVGEDRTFTSAYPGIDLPDADDGKAYMRTDEFIYIVDTETMTVDAIIYIGDVILR